MKTFNLLIATMLTQVVTLHAEGEKPNQQESITNPAKGEIYLVQSNQPRSADDIKKDFDTNQNKLDDAIGKLHSASTAEEAKQAKEEVDSLGRSGKGLIEEAKQSGASEADLKSMDYSLNSNADKAVAAESSLQEKGISLSGNSSSSKDASE